MDVIKENMFFVVMGVVVLIALALFLVLVQPLKSRNTEDERRMKSLLGNMQRLLDPGRKLPNEAAKKAAQEYRKKYEEQLTNLEQLLGTMELSTRLRGLPEDRLNQPGAFKTVYENNVRELKAKLESRGKATGTDTWHFWDWKEAVPTEKVQRDLAAREFFLVEKLVAIITDRDLNVSQVDRIEVNPGETRTGEYSASQVKRLRVEPYFDVHPFVITLRMPIHQRELLIEKLLREKSVPTDIRYVSVMRIEDDPNTNRQVPPYFVIFRVGGWALDYQRKEAETTTAGGPFMGGRPVR